jgi:death-on-curing protein
MSSGPVWLFKELVFAIHDRQIAEHGGNPGIRDDGLLESALNRPINKSLYGDPDLFELAAAYAFGIASNHPFIDGNKRVACTAALTFLLLNGHDLDEQQDEVEVFVGLAAGRIDESGLADWLRRAAKAG